MSDKNDKILSKEEIEDIVEAAVDRALTHVFERFGLDPNDRKEIHADQLFLRDLRKTTESVKRYSIISIITILTSATLGILWIGFKSGLGLK